MPDVFEEICRLRAAGERGALATVISTRGNTPGKETMRLLVRESGASVGTVDGGGVEAEVIVAAREVMENGTPRRVAYRLTETEAGGHGALCGGEIEVFIEPVTVPGLVLFGAGHVSQDLSAIAARAGFRVSVADDRAAFANTDRFPGASEIHAGETFAACFAEIHPTSSTYVVVVTRDHTMDLECVDYALHTEASYVGLIGSKTKVRAILGRLRDAGRLEGVDLSRLHAPIGLDVGATTPGEIAVAVVAELIAHRRNRTATLPAKRLTEEVMRNIAEHPARDRSAETTS